MIKQGQAVTMADINELRETVKGIVGVDWVQGTTADCSQELSPHDACSLVWNDEHTTEIADFSNHDEGPKIAHALVALHNAAPTLLHFARLHVAQYPLSQEAYELGCRDARTWTQAAAANEAFLLEGRARGLSHNAQCYPKHWEPQYQKASVKQKPVLYLSAECIERLKTESFSGYLAAGPHCGYDVPAYLEPPGNEMLYVALAALQTKYDDLQTKYDELLRECRIDHSHDFDGA